MPPRCRGGAAAPAGVWEASTVLGATVVERAIHRARRGQDLLALPASAWLQLIGTDARRAVALTLLLEYSHPTPTGAVLGETLLPQGPGFSRWPAIWSRVRTIWRDPLWPVLASSRLPGRDVLHRAADYLVNRGAAERAIPSTWSCAIQTAPAGHWLARLTASLTSANGTCWHWLARLPDGTLGGGTATSSQPG